MGVWNLQHLSSLRGQDNTLADVFCINLTGKSSSSSERAYGEVVEVGVVPSWMVSASVNLPLHHEVQKFSSGTGSSRWSRKSRKMVVVWCGVSLEVLVKFMQKTSTNMSLADVPIFCLVWKNKPNATKAHIHQSKEMYNNIKQTQKKTKARFSCLLRHPAWKRMGLFWFRRHLPTYSEPLTTPGEYPKEC